MYISRIEKRVLNLITMASMATGAAGGLGILVFLVVMRLPVTDRLVDVSGCMVAASLCGLASFGLIDLLTEARR
jgi:hypothetical protein